MPEITKELREQLRAEWVEALESGKYEQTRECLQDSHGACCLGVACDVFLKHFPEGVQTRVTSGGRVLFDDCEETLPRTVRDAYGLKAANGLFGNGELAGMNDTGSSFKEIAAVIRSRPPGLFVD